MSHETSLVNITPQSDKGVTLLKYTKIYCDFGRINCLPHEVADVPVEGD